MRHTMNSGGSCVEHCLFGGYCLNGGVCNLNLSLPHTPCICPPLYSGDHCEKIPIEKLCQRYTSVHTALFAISLLVISSIALSVMLCIQRTRKDTNIIASDSKI